MYIYPFRNNIILQFIFLRYKIYYKFYLSKIHIFEYVNINILHIQTHFYILSSEKIIKSHMNTIDIFYHSSPVLPARHIESVENFEYYHNTLLPPKSHSSLDYALKK